MDGVLKTYYHKYEGVIVSTLTFLGIWPNDSKQSNILYTIQCVIPFFTTWILILGVINYMAHSRNINALVSCIGMIISFVSVYMKGLILVFLRRDVKILSGGLSALFHRDLKVPEYQEHLLAHYHTFYRLFKAQYYCSMGFIVLGIFIPMMEALRGNYIRAYPIRVPFNYTPGGQLHWAIFAFEVISSVYMGLISFSADTVFGLFAMHTAGELRLLSHRFRSLKPGKTYREDLKDCIDRHASLIRYKTTLGKVFGFTSVTIALTCAIVVCTIIFQITQKRNISLFKLIFAIDYMAAKWFQSYAIAWFGHVIIVESERCLNSMYFTDWTQFGDLRFRKDILIIQSQKPIYINALGIMIVRLDMFIKVARATISYYCLLKTLEDKFV